MSTLHFKDICFKHECKSGSHSIYKKLPKLHIWLEINISTHKVHCFSYPRSIHWLSDWLLSSTHIHLQHKLSSTYSCNASYPSTEKLQDTVFGAPPLFREMQFPANFNHTKYQCLFTFHKVLVCSAVLTRFGALFLIILEDIGTSNIFEETTFSI